MFNNFKQNDLIFKKSDAWTKRSVELDIPNIFWVLCFYIPPSLVINRSIIQKDRQMVSRSVVSGSQSEHEDVTEQRKVRLNYWADERNAQHVVHHPPVNLWQQILIHFHIEKEGNNLFFYGFIISPSDQGWTRNKLLFLRKTKIFFLNLRNVKIGKPQKNRITKI